MSGSSRSDGAPGSTPAVTPGSLLRRAYTAIIEHGCPLIPSELIAAVFGAVSAPATVATWDALLTQLLSSSELFQRQEDGSWGLAEWSAEDLPLDAVEFVVLDVETTGLSASRHRLIEVGAIIIQGDQTRAVYQQLINPDRRIPDFISQFTGITNEMVRGAPQASKILPELQQFIGRRPVVGHNVGFDLGFLNYEAERCNWYFPTDGIDTIAMSRRFLPGLRRPKLDVLAARLGVNVRERHRALGDAQTTADVFRLLLTKAQAEGCATLADLFAALYNRDDKAPRHRMIAQARPTGSMYLNPAWRHDFPDKPGVYLMHDETGKVIYVGKAKCLKDRLASYYNHPLGYTRKMDGLLQSVKSIETRVLGSELEALLVESRLIKELQPRYNVQLRNYELYPFIKIDINSPYPRVFATRSVNADGARYFGPFNSRRAVDTTIEVIQKIFSIRTCTRALPPQAKPSDPCLRLHLGRCPAPCRGNVAIADYRKIVDEVVDFLENSREDMLDKLRDRMWRAAERDDFEKAAALRDAIRHADQVLLGQQLITGAVEANNLLIIYPSSEAEHVEIFLVRHGRLIEQRRVSGDTLTIGSTVDELLRRAIWLGPVPKRVGKAEVDQINIIARWVHRHSPDFGRAFFTLPASLDDSSVQAEFRAIVIARVQALLSGEQLISSELPLKEEG
jgi:DNA polymerase III subunit epsilon